LEGGRVGIKLAHVVSFQYHQARPRASAEAPEHIRLRSHL
jgi:hypothetical protein